jgi:hypothetical protein
MPVSIRIITPAALIALVPSVVGADEFILKPFSTTVEAGSGSQSQFSRHASSCGAKARGGKGCQYRTLRRKQPRAACPAVAQPYCSDDRRQSDGAE